MNLGKICAAAAAGAFILSAYAGAASAQTVGRVYVLHSKPDGTCPALDWHVFMTDEHDMSGMIAWNNMKSMARVSGTVTAGKSFHLNAKEVGGAGRTAVVDGTLTPGWLVVSIMGPGIDCKAIKIPVYVEGSGG